MGIVGMIGDQVAIVIVRAIAVTWTSKAENMVFETVTDMEMQTEDEIAAVELTF